MIEVPTHPNLNGLVELANRDGVDIRPTLLRVMTDLYVQKPVHSEQEEQHFTELALRLIDLVDAKTRAIIAAKVAGYPTAPAAVRHRLLKEHIALNEFAAQQKAEPPVPQQAKSADHSIAAAYAAADELSELFFTADAEERRLILLNLPYAPIVPAAPIAPAIALETTHRLEAAALGHNSELFARELERALAISRDQARRIMGDASGEPIVVAAVALGMQAAVLQRILLCINPAISQSVQRVYELSLLHEETEPGTALRLVAIWQAVCRGERKLAARRKPSHQTHYWQDDSRKPEMPAARPKIRWDDHLQSRKAEGG
jgi:uncharacterized protein (DUF2336 family)